MTIRRRWWLSGAIAACLLSGVLGWIAWRASAQHTTIEAILEFDATVYAQYGEYEYQPPLKIPVREISNVGSADSDEKEVVVNPLDFENTLTLVIGGGQRVVGYVVVDEPPEWIGWAIEMFGDDIGARVTGIYINDERFSDSDVDLLLEFPGLRELDLSDTKITDKGLTKLASLENLVNLDVSQTQVSGRSTRLLANCKGLRELDLSGTVDNAAVAEELQKQLSECWIIR